METERYGKVRSIIGVVLLSVGLVLAGCGVQKEEQGTSILEISPSLLEYRDITYGEFEKKSGREAEFLHGTRFFAQIDETEVSVVFSGDYDEEIAGPVLPDDAKCLRLDGRLGALLTGFTEEMEIADFAAAFASDEGKEPAYHEEEGAGTAYYVANHYIVVELDSDKDGKEDLMLEISMDESEKITPDSYAWIRWKE